MKRLLQFVLILAAMGLAMPARATFTLVQSPENTACTTAVAACSITVSSTGSGHLLTIYAYYSSGTITVASAASGCTGSWVHPSGTHATDGSTFGTDMAYCLSSSSGTTSVSITLSAGPTGAWHAQFREISFTGTSVTVDAGTPNGANAFRTPATLAPAGVSFTISGANDAMVQGINPAATCSAITTYTNIDTDGSGSVCSAVLLNSASGTAPTWTTASGTACVSGIAFTEAPAASNNKRALMGVGS